jgi:hypothetical protein
VKAPARTVRAWCDHGWGYDDHNPADVTLAFITLPGIEHPLVLIAPCPEGRGGFDRVQMTDPSRIALLVAAGVLVEPAAVDYLIAGEAAR